MRWFRSKKQDATLVIKPPVYSSRLTGEDFSKANFQLQEKAALRRRETERIRREAAQQAARLDAGDLQ